MVTCERCGSRIVGPPCKTCVEAAKRKASVGQAPARRAARRRALLDGARQCMASLGKGGGRCPAPSTRRYAQKQEHNDGTRFIWMQRCDEHPLANHHGVEELPALAGART
jgi:hypothetical protein